MRIKHVLVPVDFSPPSMLAVNYGVALARKFRGTLTLLTVIDPAPANLNKERTDQTARMLSAMVVPEDQDDLDLEVVVKPGDIEDGILSTVQERRIDIVVMGTHGRRLLGRIFIGSVTNGILRKLTAPILTVCRAIRPLSFKRMLFATDLSQASKEGFRWAVELARETKSTLVVVHVHDPVVLSYGAVEMTDYVRESSADEARAKLTRYAAEVTDPNVKIETVLVEGMSAADRIIKTADESDVDLVLITLERKGLIERALLGTTAESVLRGANAPVLSIPVGVARSEEMAGLENRENRG